MISQREIALNIIYKTISDASYTNLLMRKELNKLPVIQRPFVTNLVNEVLRKYDYLIYQVKEEINNKTKLKNKIIIAMALYERFFIKEKDYVVNNEYVKLGKNEYDKAFINALLRKDIILKEPNEEYIKYSLPKWLYDLLSRQYEKDELEKILDNFNRIPKVYYRLNKKKASFNDLDNIEIINDDIFISYDKNINKDYLDKGLAYIQDINSSSLYKHLDLKEDDILLDICSAPGSKLFNCLDIVKCENAYSNELHSNRLKLIEDKAKILGFEGINYLNYDGKELKNILNKKFTKIMLDVPCSGIGTIGRKPDLKYHIKAESLDELEKIQRELLDSAKELLVDGGYILYSTCTLNKKENSRQINKFLNDNKDFELIKEETIINDIGDCFYYGLIKRV